MSWKEIIKISFDDMTDEQKDKQRVYELINDMAQIVNSYAEKENSPFSQKFIELIDDLYRELENIVLRKDDNDVQKDFLNPEYIGIEHTGSSGDPLTGIIILVAAGLGVGVNELRQSGKLKEILDKIKGRFKVISDRKKL
jgi:hypothetical protein